MLVGLPSFYGAWFHVFTGLTQHAGLVEDVLDHRPNPRIVMMNPVLRFLCWNMNHHVEHHLFPMVPYHKLPALHAEIRGDLPYVCPSVWAAYKEIIPALLRQRKDPAYFVSRELPAAMAEREMALTVKAARGLLVNVPAGRGGAGSCKRGGFRPCRSRCGTSRGCRRWSKGRGPSTRRLGRRSGHRRSW